MPGTLLLDDLRDSVSNQLGDYVNGLTQQAAAAVQPIAAAIPTPQAPDPNAILQELQQHAAAAAQAAQEQAQPALQVLGGAQQAAGGALTQLGQTRDQVQQQLQQHAQDVLGGAQDVGQQLQDHVTTVLGSTTPQVPAGVQSVTVPKPAPVLGAPQAAPSTTGGDVLGGPPAADTTTPGPSRVGQGQSAFITSLQPLAQAAAARTGIDPNVMLAIAANETGWGQSQTAQQQNNLFSIQGDGRNGSRWASYDSPQQSFDAFINLVSTAPRYQQAWADRADPVKFVSDLRNAGYVADEPGYPAQGWVDQVNSINRNLPPLAPAQQTTAQARATDLGYAPAHAPSPPLQSNPDQTLLQTGPADDAGRIFPLPSQPDNAPTATYHSQGGSDLMAPRGTPVAAMQGGKVEEVFQDKGDHQFGGNAVLIHGSDGLDYYYAHFDQPTYLKQGDTVQVGQQIGAVGNTGNAFKGGTGPTHLHIGIGYGISDGVGSEGGLGKNYNAQALLTTLENGVAPKGTAPTTTTATAGQAPTALGGGGGTQNAPITMGANEPAKAPLVVPEQQAPTPIQSAADVVGGAANDALEQARQALQQAQDALGRATQGAQQTVAPILGGAQQTVSAVAQDVQNAAQGTLGAAQDLNRQIPTGTAAVNAAAPVLGGAASDLGTAARGAADTAGQTLGGLADQAHQQIVDAAQTPAGQALIQAGVQNATDPSLLPAGSRQLYQQISDAKNQWIDQNNPVRDLPFPVVAGLVSGIAQQLTDPIALATFGPTVGAGEAVGARVGAGLTGLVAERLSPAATRFVAQVGEKLSSGAIVGGLQNGLAAVEQPDATPQSVGEAVLTGAGLGAAMEAGGAAARPLVTRVGQMVIDRAAEVRPQLAAVLRSRQPAQADINFAGAGIPGAIDRLRGGTAASSEDISAPVTAATRTPISEGGLGTPQYGDVASTPEGTIAQRLRAAAVASPDGVAHLSSDEMGQLPGLPNANAPLMTRGKNAGQPNWQQGAVPALDDLRRAVDTGLPQSRWYTDFAQNIANVVGQDNINEFAALFGITSARNKVDVNTAQALGLMRMARDFQDAGTAFTPENMQTWFAANPILKGDGTPGEWAITGDKLDKIQKLYTTGQVDMVTNAKTASYAQNVISALRNRFDPNSTMDTWMNQLFNYRDSKGAAQQDSAYRGMRAVTDHLAGELGMVPHQTQAAAWFAIKAVKDAASEAGAAPELKTAVADFERGGKTTLGDLIDLGNKYGVYDAPEGTWADTAARPMVAHQLDQLTPESLSRPAPDSAQGFLHYPGKTEPVSGRVPFPVGPTSTEARRTIAEAQAPVVAGGISDAAKTGLGYDPNTRQFRALNSVPHEVQGDQVLVPGGNMDTLRYIASRIGAASGADARGATLHQFDSSAADLAGWRISGIAHGARGELLNDLTTAGIGHQVLTDGTIRANALSIADNAHEEALAAAVEKAGAKLEEINGRIQTISPADYQSTLSRFGNRYGGSERGGVPEAGRGVTNAAEARAGPAPSGGGEAAAPAPAAAPALDLSVRTLSQAEARQLVGPAYDPSGRVTRELPGPSEEPAEERGPVGREPPNVPAGTSISDVHSNPHLLNEAATGETPMSLDERSDYGDTLQQRYQANQDRLAAIDEQLRNPNQKPERPPWGAGWTNDQLVTLAKRQGLSAYEPLWWEKAGLMSGSGEVREDVGQSGLARGMGRGGTEPTPQELRQERNTIAVDQRDLEAAGEQQATAPDNARFARRTQTTADLPFAGGEENAPHGPYATEQPSSGAGSLAEDIVTQNGRKSYGDPLSGDGLREAPGEVVGTKGGITGTGISDINAEAVRPGAPSAETLARMPNLDAMLKGDLPEVKAQIQRAAEDNPQLFDAYRQGRISHDSLVTDLATKVGMTREQWLKTPIGKGFNQDEMVALQAAAIDGQARSEQMAKDIVARGGVDALSPEQVAYGLNELVDNTRLLSVARGGRSTAGRTLNALKIKLDATMARGITASNDRIAATRLAAQAKRVVARAGQLLEQTRQLETEKNGAVANARANGAPRNIVDRIAEAYDQLDRYQAMTLHEKADDFNALKAQREAFAAKRQAAVREPTQELLSALQAELKAERDNFAKRTDAWETMAFWDSKANENVVTKRNAFRGGLYIEQARKAADLAQKSAEADAKRAFNLESRRQTLQTQKATTLLEAVGGAKPSRELLAAYVQAVTSDDPLAAGKFVKGLMTPGWWGRVQTLRIAGLLSSTVTHFANMVGNVTQVPLEVATHGMVVGIDWARAKATGGERQAYMGELGPMLEAYGPGFASSMPDAVKILQTGVTPADAANLANIRPGIASGSGKVDAVLEGPLRALQAEDELFRGGAFAMQANRVATRYAIREGFQGAQLKGRAANIIQNLEDYPDLYKEAHDAMLRMVFQEHRDWIPAPRGPVRGVVSQPLPFIKTPANITAQGMGLSPFGLASTIEAVRARGALQAGGTATQAQLGRATLLAEQRIARTALGTAILGMGVGLGAGTFTAGKSMLTGAYDPNEASTYPQGWREWSVVTEDPVSGNTYYVPMQNFGAAGAPLAMAAILTDAGKRGHSLLDQDEAARAATSIGQYVLDNTFLQGLSDTVNVLHDPTRYANKFLESLVSSYGPFSALGRQVQRAYGVASRNPHDGLMGLVEAMESNYPGLSGNVPESLTAIGEPRTQGISGGAAFALPVRADILRDEPTLAALRANDVRIPPPAKAVNVGNGWSVDLTPEEQDQLERARGVAIRDWVARMQAMPAYQKGDLGTRNLYLSKAVSNASQQADVDFYRSLPRSDIRAQADGGRAVRRTVPTPYTVAGEESAA